MSTDLQDAQKALQKYWNFSDFRIQQKEVLEAVLSGKDVIALLATGGGKSLCYQVPALLYDGITIVISPLISLMEDQVMALKARGIKAEAIHSGHTYATIDRIMDNCLFGDIKLLYVSPERLMHEVFQERAHKLQVDLIAIDEAHCISQWGHDFRPSYLKISEVLSGRRNTQIIALTATATPAVIDEIRAQLPSRDLTLIKDTFLRDNLSITLHKSEDKVGEILELLKNTDKALIYARSRRNVQMISKTLINHDLNSGYYHAGLAYKEKKKIQEEFKSGKLDIVVATNAFGMGIDVSDIRHVIHYDIPPSIEEYYQEIGRAGRDGDQSRATLLLSKNNISYAKRRVEEAYPPFDQAKKFYKSLHVFYQIGIGEGTGIIKPLDMELLARQFGMNKREISHLLGLWQKIGVIETSDQHKASTYIKIQRSPAELREEQERHQQYLPVLDYLMRNYEYLFDGWLRLNMEKDLRRLRLSKQRYDIILEELLHHGIIKLYRLSAGRMVSFTEDRVSMRYLDDFETKYRVLKERAEKRWKGVEQFLDTKRCRMATILDYFDEKNTVVCGKCDICLDMDGKSQKLDLDEIEDLERR